MGPACLGFCKMAVWHSAWLEHGSSAGLCLRARHGLVVSPELYNGPNARLAVQERGSVCLGGQRGSQHATCGQKWPKRPKQTGPRINGWSRIKITWGHINSTPGQLHVHTVPLSPRQLGFANLAQQRVRNLIKALRNAKRRWRDCVVIGLKRARKR